MTSRWSFEGVTLHSPADGSGETSHGLELIIDELGLSQRGGSPTQVLQIPWAELRGMRCLSARRGHGPQILAVLGAVAMAWEVQELDEAGVKELDAFLRSGPARRAGAAGHADAEAEPGLVPDRFARVPRALMAVLLAVVVVLLASGIGRQATNPTKPAPAILLHLSDLPSGWRLDIRPSSFTGSLLAPSNPAKVSASDQAKTDAVAKQYEWCIHANNAHDRVFGKHNAKPSAEAQSPVYVAPTMHGYNESGSTYQYYDQAAEVSRDLSQVTKAEFSACYGAAVGTLLSEGFASAGIPGVTSTASPWQLTPALGVKGSGVEIRLQIPGQNGTVEVDLLIALLGAGHEESTLYLYAPVGSFPKNSANAIVASLSAQLSQGSSQGGGQARTA